MGKYYTDGLTMEQQKKEIMKKNGEKIKRIRNSNGLTQKKLIDSLEIKGGKTLVSNVEHGKRTLPANVLPFIADLGDTTVESLFTDKSLISTGNICYNCLTHIDYSEHEIENIMRYLDYMTEKSINNIGYAKLFDCIFAILRTSSMFKMEEGRITDEVMLVDKTFYDNNKSRYEGYIKEMASISKENLADMKNNSPEM